MKGPALVVRNLIFLCYDIAKLTRNIYFIRLFCRLRVLHIYCDIIILFLVSYKMAAVIIAFLPHRIHFSGCTLHLIEELKPSASAVVRASEARLLYFIGN